MKHHPYAEIFPMMNDAEIEILAADIKANGQKEVITLYHNQILDGRNRYAACIKAHVTPNAKELIAGTDAFKFVISKNLHRRHLDETGRSFLAAQLVKIGREVTPVGVQSISVSKAAEAVNVSPRSVDRALKIENEASPELKEAVKTNRVSLSKAVEQIKPKATITPQEQSSGAYRHIKTYLDKLILSDAEQLGIDLADYIERLGEPAEDTCQEQ